MTSTQETLPSNSKHLAEFQRYAERLATLGADVATLATAVEFLTYCDVETLQSLLENLQIRYRAVLTLSHESTHDIAHTLFLLSQEMVLWMTIVQAELGKKAFDSYRSLLQTGELLTIPVESIPGKIQDFLLALQAHSEVEHTIPLVHLGGKQDAEQTAFDMANGTIGHTAGDCAKRFSTAEMPQVPLQIICVPPNQLLRPIAQAFAREQQVAQQNHFFEMPHSSSRILYKFWTEQILALIEQLPGTHSVDDAADILGLLGDDHIEVLQAYLLNDPGAAE